MATRKLGFRSPVPIKARESTEKLWGYNRARRGVDWADVDPQSLRASLMAALDNGGAVMFSSAAGGLGVGVTYFSDGDKVKEYAATTEELVQLLEQVIDFCSTGSVDYRQLLGGAVLDQAK